jgi:hypothetical protein
MIGFFIYFRYKENQAVKSFKENHAFFEKRRLENENRRQEFRKELFK